MHPFLKWAFIVVTTTVQMLRWLIRSYPAFVYKKIQTPEPELSTFKTLRVLKSTHTWTKNEGWL